MGYRRRAKPLTKAKKQARKRVDINQNKAIMALTRQVKKLTSTTLERKYMLSTDTFNLTSATGGTLLSRQIIRLNSGTYDGLDTKYLFGSTAVQGDYVFVKYLKVDLWLTNWNNLLDPEHSPSPFQVFLLKPRKSWDPESKFNIEQANGLSNSAYDVADTGAIGQTFVNPKLFKVIKYRDGVLGATGGSADEKGYGKNFYRYRWTIPINKRMMIEAPSPGDNTFTNHPQNFQDQLYIMINSSGTSADAQSGQARLHIMTVVDDAGDN